MHKISTKNAGNGIIKDTLFKISFPGEHMPRSPIGVHAPSALVGQTSAAPLPPPKKQHSKRLIFSYTSFCLRSCMSITLPRVYFQWLNSAYADKKIGVAVFLADFEYTDHGLGSSKFLVFLKEC